MIILKSGSITLSDMDRLLFHGEKAAIDPTSLKNVHDCHSFLKDFARDKIIYGINTGFGPMAQYRVNDQHLHQLQYNLIRSHASGTGKIFPTIDIKAAMIARVASFLRAYSGVHPSVVELLIELANRDIYPVIYEHGGVGASGDLVQLAHLALSLIGEGEVLFEGKIMPTGKIFSEQGLQPVKMHIREGLALINGTSVMTGTGLVNLFNAQQVLDWSLWASSVICEIVGSFDDHFSSGLNQAKDHEGQKAVASKMRQMTQGSKRLRKRDEYFYHEKETQDVFTDKVQEYYSLRCVPQILGPVYDTLQNVSVVLVSELNSANDNPVIDVKHQNVYHGGNFHGDYVAFEMDKLKIAITKLTMLAERQLNYLMHDRINNLLPPFLNLGKPGLNYGMQAVQFTATSTTAECQTLSNPMYIHSIPNNNDNQDIVSMGTNAAVMARMVIENAFQVLAIETMAIIQAVKYLDIESQLSPFSQNMVSRLKEISPAFIEDTPKYPEIKNLADFLKKTRLP